MDYAVIEIDAGNGSAEACFWVGRLCRMYRLWAEERGYAVDLISSEVGGEALPRRLNIEISGPRAYSWLLREAGVHRFIRISPFDSAHRRHTSFVTVNVTQEIVDCEVYLPSALIRSYIMDPYFCVKDHRTGHETDDVTAVLDGQLEQFLLQG